MADAEPTVTAPPNPADAPQAPAAPIMPVAIFKKRGAKGKANLRKRPATPPPAAASDSDDNSSDFSSSEDEATGQRVRKRRKRNPAVAAAGVVTAASSAQDGKIHKGGEEEEDPTAATVFKAERKLDLESGKREATKHANWFDDEDLSAKNLLGSTRKVPPAKKDAAAEEQQPKRNIGPVKPPPSHIRTITITDMAPDVCKDWKQTGFCGFGDGCKFLHAREDYAYGWQLDKEWEKVTKGKKVLQGTIVSSAERKATGRRLGAGEEEDDDDGAEEAMLEAIPFACIICRGPYKSPVVTRCGHYFCEGCALGRYRRDPSCAACGAGTNGVFNAAKKLQKLLQKKKEREERRKREARERGEEVSEDEEEGDGEEEG
ncbi:hypothetical protein VTJ04DRAFT_2360 [Mycothermus thermophilus]|uniref:uncharacterized protein n=1 Tax=Humicola insolens TaxID=85995 RepID=UPI00374447C5